MDVYCAGSEKKGVAKVVKLLQHPSVMRINASGKALFIPFFFSFTC